MSKGTKDWGSKISQLPRETTKKRTNKQLFCTLHDGCKSKHIPFTLPPIIMVQWKMGRSNISFLSFRVIFRFHDYVRKGKHYSPTTVHHRQHPSACRFPSVVSAPHVEVCTVRLTCPETLKRFAASATANRVTSPCSCQVRLQNTQ